MRRWAAFAALVLTLTSLSPADPSDAATLVTRDLTFRTDDGVVLHATVGGFGDLRSRPLIVESSPYAPGCCNTFAGDAYNYVQLHWRGTGRSGGTFTTTGPRDQKDLAGFLDWACGQPWSNGRIGLYGFSASAILVYNSMHQHLPCVQAASLGSGTVSLYRDLLYRGGINNAVPGLVVAGGIGGPWLANQHRNNGGPAAWGPGGLAHLMAPVDVGAHPTEDAFWRERSFRGNHDGIPILAGGGFYDVESRGAFEAYRANRQHGAHLLVLGAHDGSPTNIAGPHVQYARWFDRYLRDVDNGIDGEPAVQTYLSNGSHRRLIDGHFTKISGAQWPLEGTRYTRWYLDRGRSGSALSINDGTLGPRPPSGRMNNAYVYAPSDGLATDPHTISTVITAAGALEPPLTDLRAVEPVSLTYTTPPLTSPMNVVGPGSLEVYVSSTLPVTDLVAVIADVWPDGSSHPVAQGQLRTNFNRTVTAASIVDSATVEIVQPHPDFSHRTPAQIAQTRWYRVPILPIGNRFEAGHRLRLYIVGTSVSMIGSIPGLNTVSAGSLMPSRLILPER